MEDWRQKPTVSVEEAGRILGIGRNGAYTQAHRYIETRGAEGIPVLKFGRLLVVPVPRLLAMLGADPPERDPTPGGEGPPGVESLARAALDHKAGP